MKSFYAAPIAISALLFTASVLAQVKPIEPATVNKRPIEINNSQDASSSAKGVSRSPYIIRLTDPAVAQYTGGIRGLQPTKTRTSRVDTKSKPVVAYQQYLQQQQQTVLSQVAQITGSNKPLRQFHYAINGMILNLTAGEAESIRSIKGVKAVEPDKKLRMNTDSSIELTGAMQVWNGIEDNGLMAKGEGTVVAVFDTGINTDHPSFAATGGDGYIHTNPLGNGTYLGDCAEGFAHLCNDKLIGVYSYALITNEYSDTDVFPVGLPRNGEDYNGHGSHVAGTAAGNVLFDVPVYGLAFDEQISDGYPGEFAFDQISGIAPHANIISFQTCLPGETDDTYNGCYYSLAISAIDDAIRTGVVDVINYSISGGEAIWGDALSEAWLSANNAGIFVAHSAGNDGPALSTSDKYAPWITPVAATDHGRQIDFSKTLSDFSGGLTPPGVINGLSNTGGITTNVVYAGDFTNPNDPDGDPAQCLAPFPAGTFNGEIVMCDRGEIARVLKAKNVADGGAGGYILANVSQTADNLVGDVYVIPGIHVDVEAGNQLRSWLSSGSDHRASISSTAGVLSIDESALDTLASFSSRGPNSEISTLLPMISAPGVQVYAAYSDEHYGHETSGPAPADYAYLDGTSMASPHVAGAAALVRQIHPDWSADAIRSALMMTANTNLKIAGSQSSASWLDMGAGRIQVDKAVNAGLIIEETQQHYLAANPASGGDPKTLNIAGLVDDNCLIQCSWQRTFTATKTGSWTVSTDAMTSDLELIASPSSFSLSEGETQTVTFTVNTWNARDGNWEFGKILLSSDTSPDLHLPLAVIASNGNFPERLTLTSSRNADSTLLKDLVAIEINDFTATTSSLVMPVQVEQALAQDTQNDAFLDDVDDGVYLQTITIADDAARFVAYISASTAPDLDLYLIFDADADEVISGSDIIARSEGTSWDEYININEPEPGTYYLFVQNYTGSSNSTADDFTLEYAVVDDSGDGSLRVEGPASAALREPFDMRVSWQLANALEGERAFGVITLGSSADAPDNLGRLNVDIRRDSDDVSISSSSGRVSPGDTAEYLVKVKRNDTNEDRDYEITVTLPQGTSVVSDSVGNGGIVNGNTISWQVTQTANTSSQDYVVTTNQTDAACDLPDVGQGQGYIDLQAMGIEPKLGHLNTAFANYPLQVNVLNSTLSSINVSSKGVIVNSDAPFTSVSGTNPSLNNLVSNTTLIAPLWRDWHFAPTDTAGIAAAYFDNGNVSVVEWNEMVNGEEHADFEVVFVNKPSVGQANIMFAYRNVAVNQQSPLTIGYSGQAQHFVDTLNRQTATTIHHTISSNTVVCLTQSPSIQANAEVTLPFTLRLDDNAAVTGSLSVSLSSTVTNIPGADTESIAPNTDVEVHASPEILINGEQTSSLSMIEGQATSLPISISDANGDSVSLSVRQISGPSAVIDIAGDTVTITPDAVSNGNQIVVEVTATDTFGFSNTATVTINVLANQPPVLTVSAPASVQEQSTITITASATDPENDTVTFTINNVPGASFSSTAPETDSTTSVTFTVTASDGYSTVTETVTVTVTNRSEGGGSVNTVLLLGLLILTLWRRIHLCSN